MPIKHLKDGELNRMKEELERLHKIKNIVLQ
jgi:hypothetical protein